MKKKLVSMLLVSVMAVSMTACGAKETATTEQTTAQTEAVETTETAATEAAEEAAAFAETEAAETPVPLEEQPGTVPAAEDMADAESENNDEKFPDDIPAEGFYELLFDLDEMMKLGII